MTDTQWTDISEFQIPVDDRYPYGFICIRSNDGSYLDQHFSQNLAWCRSRLRTGKLWGYMVYYFYRPGVDGAAILRQRVGTPDSRMVAMIDVESAEGQVRGNQSGAINHQYGELAAWLGNTKRVVGYGNVYDLNALWPSKPPGLKIITAGYGTNPPYPNKYAHQYLDNARTPPFGTSDLNSADGMSRADLEKMYGFTSAPAPAPKPIPKPVPKSTQLPEEEMWLPNSKTVPLSFAGADVGTLIFYGAGPTETLHVNFIGANDADVPVGIVVGAHSNAPVPAGCNAASITRGATPDASGQFPLVSLYLQKR